MSTTTQEPSGLQVAESGDTPVIAFVEKVIYEACKRGAKDIRLSTLGDNNIDYNLGDGVWRTIASERMAYVRAAITRLKIVAGMSIAEQRRIQRARINFVHPDVRLAFQCVFQCVCIPDGSKGEIFYLSRE
jgi:type II secretory ATPase GspE/PulE/Tfp pilus assembly ATPase PilB-like protein